MKVNELSKLTGVNIETIRSYREKGLLHPEKLKNGYYDYGLGDYISLIYIRKYRGYSIGLNDISSFYSAKSNEEILAVIDKEQQILSERIARLEEEKRYLDQVQKLIDNYNNIVEEKFKEKEKELMSI